MSTTLERVIADQQAEIDRLKDEVEFRKFAARSRDESLGRAYEEMDAVVRLVFRWLAKPDDVTLRGDVRTELMEMGYCWRCYSRDCECGDYE